MTKAGKCTIYRTEVDGIEVTWRLDYPPGIVIIKVYKISEDRSIAAFDSDRCPDLADARARFPKLEELWDAVRHDFWSRMAYNRDRPQPLW